MIVPSPFPYTPSCHKRPIALLITPHRTALDGYWQCDGALMARRLAQACISLAKTHDGCMVATD